MLCKHPFIRDPTGKVFKSTNKEDWIKGIPFPCGQCLACRINRRRIWSTRLWLEAMSHSENMPMITLTYSDDELPYTIDYQPTLCKRDVQLFLKRVRKHLEPLKIRFYCAGEYGERTHRPHYHILLFGVGIASSSIITALWPHGLVHIGYDTSAEATQYVAGYVTKKVVKRSNNETRTPEFSLMSRKPAIGSIALKVIVQVLEKHPEIIENVLRNPTLKINGNYSPLGRTLADKLRTLMDSDNTIDPWLYEMRKLALDKIRNYDPSNDVDLNGPLVKALIEESAQRNVQIEKHFNIWKRRDKV